MTSLYLTISIHASVYLSIYLTNHPSLTPEFAGNMGTTTLIERCNKWKESYSWLSVFERGSDVILVCSTCPCDSAWGRGKVAKSSTQRSELANHVASVTHKKGMSMGVAHPIIHGLRNMSRQTAAREEAAAEKSKQLSYACWSIHLAKMSHFICKRALPYSLLDDLSGLVRECVLGALEEGVDPKAFRIESTANGGLDKPMYGYDKTASEFALILAELETRRTVEGILRAGCYGLSVDEGTDITVSKVLTMSVRYVCMDTGVVKNRNLGLLELPGGTSDEVYAAIVRKLSELRLSAVPLVGFSSDGASAMVGATNGVAAKLKNLFPALISTHCAAHRLNLAASDVSSSLCEHVEDLAGILFTFFARSLSRLLKLSKAAKDLDAKFVRLARPADTRWLSIGKALKNIVRMYQVLLAYLSTETTTMARQLHVTMSKLYVKLSVCYMSDVTNILNCLSLKLQARTVTIFEVRRHVLATCVELDALSETELQSKATTPGLCTFMDEHLGQVAQDEDSKGRVITELDPYVKELNEYAAKVARELRRRFPEDASAAVKAFECLYPHMMPQSGTTQTHFGLDQFDYLCNCSKPLLPASDGPVEEFQIYKAYVAHHWRSLQATDFVRASLSDTFLRRSCPLTHRLLVIAATLPMTSVECER